ncbi:MAG TPA: alginate export family protein, partial [Methylomirabilota bacterium]|nr:alginate export family protein [Methylomirabilota bacterium]
IADPENIEINRAQVSWKSGATGVTFGRQRIILDNARFVGNVGWRQNEQTYDAISLQNTSLDDTTLFYGFVHNINRVVGDDHPAGDFHSKAHLFNASYAGFKPGKLTGYAYLLDIQDAPAASANTFGASFAGAWPVNEDVKVNYRAEFAWQTDAGDNATDYEAEYLNFELGGSYKHFNAGAGYELLGSDNGVGFSTPLATLHAFNGWADVFLATPGDGLQDFYGWVGCTLPGQFPLKVIYHQFYSDDGNDDYGSEIDAVISRKLGKHWTALAKYAHYDGDGPFASRDKLWLQVEFSY